jgi:hypothetical protein
MVPEPDKKKFLPELEMLHCRFNAVYRTAVSPNFRRLFSKNRREQIIFEEKSKNFKEAKERKY